jgi:hypothetical protein
VVYHPGTDMVQDEKANLRADFHNMLNMWKTHFFHLLNVCGNNDVGPIEILLLQCFCMASEMSLGIDEIAAELIKKGDP